MNCTSIIKRFGIFILAFVIIVSSTAIPIFAANNNAETTDFAQSENRVIAFKGAEGAGMYSKAQELHWTVVRI